MYRDDRKTNANKTKSIKKSNLKNPNNISPFKAKQNKKKSTTFDELHNNTKVDNESGTIQIENDNENDCDLDLSYEKQS